MVGVGALTAVDGVAVLLKPMHGGLEGGGPWRAASVRLRLFREGRFVVVAGGQRSLHGAGTSVRRGRRVLGHQGLDAE